MGEKLLMLAYPKIYTKPPFNYSDTYGTGIQMPWP